MCGKWTKRSRRIFRKLLKEVNGGLVDDGGEMTDEVDGGWWTRRKGRRTSEVRGKHRVV
jgi:hypothetical protein